MSDKLRQKVIRMKQRSAMREVMEKIGEHLIVAGQIFHPESGQIAYKLNQLLSENKYKPRSQANSCETHSLDELDAIFSEFIATIRDSNDFLCVLPGVSIIDDVVTTGLPVLKTNAVGVGWLYDFFSRSNEFDFFGIISNDRNAFMVISSHADAPGDANQFFDGPVYEVLFGST